MKDLLNRFSFGDFVAYFLPGLATLGAAATIASYTPLLRFLPSRMNEISVVQALALACVAYMIGALVSGSSAKLVPIVFRLTRLKRFEDPRDGICPYEFAGEIHSAFGRTFPELNLPKWSSMNFYLMRTCVHQTLPQAAAECIRQNSLMQLRENLLLPVIAWGCVGILFGIEQRHDNATFGLIVVLLSTAATYTIMGRLAGRACENRRREVREVCLAFLVAERLGLLASAAQRSNVSDEKLKTHLPPSFIQGEVAGEA